VGVRLRKNDGGLLRPKDYYDYCGGDIVLAAVEMAEDINGDVETDWHDVFHCCFLISKALGINCPRPDDVQRRFRVMFDVQ
jgi:hypothetical protein